MGGFSQFWSLHAVPRRCTSFVTVHLAPFRRCFPDCYGGSMITLVRRVAAAMSMAGMVATFFRLRGTGGTPPRSGGWREVDADDLR